MQLNQLINSQKKEFDMIMLNDIIEHLHESPKELLLSLLALLKDDGILFITVPNAGNIKKRLKNHNDSKGAKFTRGRKWRLKYFKSYSTKGTATPDHVIRVKPFPLIITPKKNSSLN